MDMRGLSNFISEIREATSSREAEQKRVAEELGKIRAKFRDNSALSAYDRKKYVCKLLFIFMLGYEVDFGHMEAVQLLAGQSASEKLIGYLAISVLLNENHPLIMLTTHTMTVDIAKGSELQKTLALAAVANIGSKEMVESVARHVMGCLASRTVSIPVRKRAILAALHIFRKMPSALDVTEVGAIIAGFVASEDFAVSTCACAFAEELLKNKETRDHVLGAKSSALSKLYSIIVDRRTPNDYVQYQVPAPWLQVKLLRLLQYFPPPSDQEEADKLSLILSKIIKASEKVVAEVQHQMAFKKGANSNRSNLFVATLIEAVSLSILWDCDSTALGHARDALGVMIADTRDPNVKSLGLMMLSRMSFCSSYNFSEHVILYQSTVVQALHDRDNSVRLRALDLLNAMCNKDNAGNIVGELQEYLKVSHPSIREDLVLLIAVLAEKFCADAIWYVEVLMYLLEEAGQFIPEDVWQRLVHIVVNTPAVQKHAVSLLMKSLNAESSENAPEVIITVACILLGEFGYQIALNNGSTPLEQLQALHGRWHNVSDSVRAQMLHTFVKFYNLYDDRTTRDRILKIFAAAKTSLDAEVQQRATEYFALCTTCNDDVLLACLEPLPEFDVGADTLVARLRQRQHGSNVNNTNDDNDDASAQKSGSVAGDHWTQKAQERDAKQMKESNIIKNSKNNQQSQQQTISANSSSQGQQQQQQQGSNIDDIFGVGSSASHNKRVNAQQQQNAAASSSSSSSTAHSNIYDDIFDSAPKKPVTSNSSPLLSSSSSSAAPNPSLAIEKTINVHIPDLYINRTGRLLQDNDFISIDVVSFDTRGSDIRMTLKISNPSVTQKLEALAVQISSTPNGLLLQMQPPSSVVIEAGSSVTVNFAGRAQTTFSATKTPLMTVSCTYFSGSSSANNKSSGGATTNNVWTASSVPLPISLSSFVEPYKTDDAQRFQTLWEQLGNDANVTTQKKLLSGVGGGLAIVEKMLGTACHLHCFRAAGNNTMCFGMGALATQPADSVQYSAVLGVAQQAPGKAGEFAVAFRSSDNNVSQVALARFNEACKSWLG